MFARQAFRPSVAPPLQSVAPSVGAASTSKVTLDILAAGALGCGDIAQRCVLPRDHRNSAAALFSTSAFSHAAAKGARAIAERDLQKELAKLQAKVAEAEKARDAQEAADAFGDITEDTLDQLFEAISTPDPPSAEELRFAQRRRQRAQLRLSRQQEDLGARLEAIVDRLEAFNQHAQAQSDTAASEQHTLVKGDDPIDRITAAVRRLNEARQRDALDTAEFDQDIESGLAENASPNDLPAAVSEYTPLAIKASGQRALECLEEYALRSTSITTLSSALPVPIIGLLDFKDLARSIAASADSNQDLTSLKRQFDIMTTLGHGESRSQALDAALNDLADRGEVSLVLGALDIAQECGVTTTQFTSHCLVKAHTAAGQLKEADQVLSQLEESKPADMMTYSLVIKALLAQRGNTAMQSQVYEIFTRMRLRAHPTPDALLFSQVIQACALGVPQPKSHLWRPTSRMLAEGHVEIVPKRQEVPGKHLPDTERAFDYFQEMTVRLGIRPTVEVYDAIILACARRRDMYDKALELLQNVIELERRQASTDGEGGGTTSAFAPSVTTFNAVLAGCARNGDLFRARWILAEMLRVSVALWRAYEERLSLGISKPWERQEAISRRPNAETLALVFYAYASYTVPSQAPIRQTRDSAEKTTGQNAIEQSSERDIEARAEEQEDDVHLSRQLPQTRRAVVAEIDGLLARLLADKRDESGEGLFADVVPHSKLINAYLAAINAHSKGESRLSRIKSVIFENNVDDAEDRRPLLEHLDVPLNGHICATVLEALLTENDRQQADDLVQKIWQLWQPLEDSWRKQQNATPTSDALDASVISRAWAARIGNLAKSRHLDEAMECVHLFAALYPPPVSQNSRIVIDVPEGSADRPVLTHQALSLLHHRLKVQQYAEPTEAGVRRIGRHIATVTWTAHAYESLLRPKVPGAYRREPQQPRTLPSLKRRILKLDIPSSRGMQGRHSSL